MDWLEKLLNWQVGVYLLVVIATQILPPYYFNCVRRRVARRRAKVGLPPDILMNASERLERFQFESLVEAISFLGAIILAPPFLLWITRFAQGELSKDIRQSLLVTFIAILVWLLVQGTDVAKAFLAGLAFKTLVAFQVPFQTGDKVTLKGHSGKVTKIGIFFITLETPDDDLVSIPSKDLWSEVLVSANAGDRSSLCVMHFYLAPSVTNGQRQGAEDAIWDAMQASAYCEAAKPMQIYLSQEPSAICLTAKAYVTSTYDEPLFKSDVTRAFFEFVGDEGIPLGSGQWKLQ